MDYPRRGGASELLCAPGVVALRIVFTLVVVNLLGVPYLRIFGGLLVIFIAIKLPFEDADGTEIDAKQTLFSAVASIIVADAVMSLDNVLRYRGRGARLHELDRVRVSFIRATGDVRSGVPDVTDGALPDSGLGRSRDPWVGRRRADRR